MFFWVHRCIKWFFKLFFYTVGLHIFKRVVNTYNWFILIGSVWHRPKKIFFDVLLGTICARHKVPGLNERYYESSWNPLYISKFLEMVSPYEKAQSHAFLTTWDIFNVSVEEIELNRYYRITEFNIKSYGTGAVVHLSEKNSYCSKSTEKTHRKTCNGRCMGIWQKIVLTFLWMNLVGFVVGCCSSICFFF